MVGWRAAARAFWKALASSPVAINSRASPAVINVDILAPEPRRTTRGARIAAAQPAPTSPIRSAAVRKTPPTKGIARRHAPNRNRNRDLNPNRGGTYAVSWVGS